MSEDLVYCVRGCRRQCREDECIADPESCEHDTWVQADLGQLCSRCAERLTQAIAEIPDLYAGLPGLYETSQSAGPSGLAHSKVTGSPALIRLDVLVLAGNGGPGWGDGGGGVDAALFGWVRLTEEELGLTCDDVTITGMVKHLTAHRAQVYAQPWVGEMHDDLVGVWRALRRATGLARPIGRCWGRIANRADGGCGRMLYPPPPGRVLVCPNEHCGRTYNGPEILRMAAQSMREGIA